MWQPFEYAAKSKIIFGKNSLERLGEIVESFSVKRVVIVTDQGIIDAGHAQKAIDNLTQKDITTFIFNDFAENPTTDNVNDGVAFAKENDIELIVGLGGGSSMDCAKGINFILTNGGEMPDYWGYGKAQQPMLPMIGIPTTTGTGSEAQSYALISDAKTRRKMACGDPKAAFKVAILDPELTKTQPVSVIKATGIDAISHAVESAVTKRRNAMSASFSLYAWKLLNENFERMLFEPSDADTSSNMQIGACYSGMAIESSMLGAAHASANPLTKNFGITHGHAIALMLPHVIRYNATHAQDIYEDLCRISGITVGSCAGKALARRVEKLISFTELPTNLQTYGVTSDAINGLAAEASKEWTAQFNPRMVKHNDFVTLYNRALQRIAMSETKKDTGVGSYFVSNYPPYSFWKNEHQNTVLELLNKPAQQERNLGFYMHIPFCRKRCKFCYFRVYTDKNKKQREDYLYNLVKELEIYAKSPVVAGRPVKFFYVGGGTPSALAAEQIEYLGQQLQRIFPKNNVEEVTFECEPGTLSEKKLEAIRNFGTTRLSLGVENFSDEILKENGRAHLSEEIFRAYEWVKKLDFPQVNIDLISGMMGETEANWQSCIEQTIDLRPTSVTIYQMELPFNSIYAKQILGEEGICKVATWETKRRWVQDAFEQLKKVGYQQSSAYTVVLPSDQQTFCYRDELWYGADMIGTGVASFSHLQGVHYQNIDKFDSYMEKCAQGEFPIHRAFPTTDRHRLIRELILRMKLGYLKRQEFLDKFSVDILNEFATQFSTLQQQGMLVENNEGVQLTPQGLLQVDSLLPNFYDPEYQNARYT